METLRFTGLHEDGSSLVVTAADGTDYLVPIEDRLRAAVRHPSSRQAPSATPVTPRDVQSMVRGGMTPEEVSEQTGWEVARVQRYEGAIVAEREHIARLARAALIRTHERTGVPPTLGSRALERLGARGVSLERVSWDATRPEGGQWTVVITFVAGQRDRHASWRFDQTTRSVDALDDEARWLSEDEQSLPREIAAAAVFGRGQDVPDDLMSSMRERSRKRGRSRRGRAAATQTAAAAGPEIEAGESPGGLGSPDSVPGREGFPDQALPLEEFPYDPDTMGLPPSAHGHIDDHADGEAGDGGAGAGAGADHADAGADHAGAGADHADAGEGAAGGTGADDLAAGDDHPNAAAEAAADESDDDESDDDDATKHEPTLEDFFGPPLDPDPEQNQDQDADHRADHHDEAGAEQPDPEPTEGSDAGDSSKARRRGRPSVPSWDDIMFGARGRGR